MNILVVEDEKLQINAIRRGLKSRGYQITEALSAQEALEALDKNGDRIDMVLTDYRMPGMSGMDLLKNIREKNLCLPVMMMTAYGDKTIAKEALLNQCDGFIEKPLSLKELLKEIDRVKAHYVSNQTDQDLSEFIPLFLHQMNNSLVSILGGAEVAAADVSNPEAVSKYLTIIVKAAEKVFQISKELINLTRPSEKKGGEELVDVKEILEDSLTMFSGLMVVKKVRLEKNIGIGKLRVAGSQFKLEQVLKNLILNAIEAMERSHEKWLKIRAAVDEIAAGVRIDIEDTGCGIGLESMEKIFVPFYTSKKHGTGLGLHIVRKFVQEMGCALNVKSRVEKGSIFTVRIPFAEKLSDRPFQIGKKEQDSRR